MKKPYLKLFSGAVLAVSLLLTSCHSAYEVTRVEGNRVPIDSTWDAEPDAEATALLAPYKAKIDSIMYSVAGTAEISMDRSRPESLLSNWWQTSCVNRLRKFWANLRIWGWSILAASAIP